MALSATAKNAMLDELGTLVTHIALANAGTELTGGTYARQAVAWDEAAAGVLAMTGTEEFNVPGSSTVNRVCLKGHLSDVTPDYGFAPVTEEVFGGDGTYTVTALTITLSDPA
jgi:hypothetical protein